MQNSILKPQKNSHLFRRVDLDSALDDPWPASDGVIDEMLKFMFEMACRDGKQKNILKSQSTQPTLNSSKTK